MASVFVVEMACLACGRDSQATVPTLAELPHLPARCVKCGGSGLAVSTTERLIRPVATLDWSADRPRRGRPPARLGRRYSS